MRLAKIYFLVLFCAGIPAIALSTEASRDFIMETDTLIPYFPGYLGNGHFSLVSSQLGINDAESYMAWVYDHGKEDVPRIAVIPAWNTIDIHNGTNWISKTSMDENTIHPYNQRINMYDGTLETRYQWVDGQNTMDIQVQSFVSRANSHLAAVKLVIVPHFNGPIQLSFSIRDWPDPKRIALEKLEKLDPSLNIPRTAWYPGNMVVKERDAKKQGRGGRAWMITAPEGRQTSVAEIIEPVWSSEIKGIDATPQSSASSASIEIKLKVEANKPYTFYKYIGIASSRNSKDPFQEATAALDTTKSRSYESILAEHTRVWHDLWKTDIVLEGAPDVQNIIHSMIFYVLCSTAAGTDFSIPPMGLSGAGYYGHMFWDADTWMFPSLVIMHPEIAKSLVMFRFKTLDAAQFKAKNLGYQGAMYPWEADETGNETTPQFAYQNALYEIHVSGDVAVAQWQYYLATGDQQWLSDYGFQVIEQTANFWVSRSTFNQQKSRYEIQKVVSVDEGLIGINNDAYTNAVAKKNLEIAIAASRLLGREPNPNWEKVSKGMFIPYNEAEAYHPSYENAPATTLGSVVPLLAYPLELPITNEAKKNDLENAVKLLRREGSGAMMGVTLLTAVAVELGDQKLIDEIWKDTFKPYLRPPFHALSETPRNDATNFLTGAGGFLQQIIFGYTGLRLTENGIVKKFSPVLPSTIKKLTLKNFRVRNQKFELEVP
jgi:trehalose/maltose hydrolase-like predicted phosphorylase